METTGGRSPRRAAFVWSTIVAIALMAVLAINAPLTFASVSSGGGTATLQRTAQTQATTDQSIADVAAVANKATVTILNLTDQSQFGQSGQLQPQSAGSGYIIDTAGHVVTNNHVVEGGTAFQVQLIDGTTVDATLVGSDPYQDVAVLKLELKAGQTVPGTLSFGDSSTVRAGDTVIAIGSPFGEYNNTVSSGIVNAVDRSLDTGSGYRMPNLIQHDAEIYPGNSGGPLVAMDGTVVGMNVAKAVDPTTGAPVDGGIGFAIESNAVKALVQEIIQTGKVARPYLGIRAQMVQGGGAGITEVEQDGPAAQAGLEPGDVITAIDGKQVTDANPFINQLIFSHKTGDQVTLTVERGGQELSLTVTLGERPAPMQ